MHPPIDFLTTPDSVRLAVSVHGEGPPLVYVRGWITNLEAMWEVPTFRSYMEALGSGFRVVRYDGRGNGLSDRHPERRDLNALVDDLRTVVDGLGLTDVVLLAEQFGGPIAIRYAVEHPDRVARLVLDTTWAKGTDVVSEEEADSIVGTLRTLPEAALLLLQTTTSPDEPEEADSRMKAIRRSIDPETAADLYELGFGLDVRDLLHRAAVPSLVIHPRGRWFSIARDLASRLPDARLVTLEGQGMQAWSNDPDAALEAIADFCGVEIARRRVPPSVRRDPEGTLTFLFTDIVGSTAMTERLGDRGAQDVLREHNRLLRDRAWAHGGRDVKFRGDGFMFAFGSATRALACAVEIQRELERHTTEEGKEPLRVRMGVNTAEAIAEDDDYHGLGVILAARIADEADGGQILVSELTRRLSEPAAEIAFDDGREVELKGVREPQRVYAVRLEQASPDEERPG